MSGPVATERSSTLPGSPLSPAMQSAPSSVAALDDLPGVGEWLAGRRVLVTGGTGFIGQLLVEKLLRACPDICAIYLLVRDKRGETPQRRVDKLMDDPVFERVRSRRDKVVLVMGDLEKPGLGLSPEDRALLLDGVHVVLHCAATVRFDAPLRTAAAINVRATVDVVRLAKEMKQLQAFVHMSTAFAFCNRLFIEERVYKPRMTAEQLLNMVEALDDTTLDNITPALMDPWPNTYVFTKAIAEELVLRESKGFPFCIFRPSMVVSATKEPIPGWINNINGPVGLVLGAGLGLLRICYIKDGEQPRDMIPADIVVNATLAAAWKTGNMRNGKPIPSSGNEGEEVPVYNCVSSARNPVSWNEFRKYNEEFGVRYPSEHCLWYYFLVSTKSRLAFHFLAFFLHIIPAIIVDTFLYCAGRKTMLLKAYNKIHKFIMLTTYFQEYQWTFTDTKIQWLWNEMKESDKGIFPFNIEDLDWRENVSNLIPGLRVYFLKDPLSTLDKGRVKYRRLKIMHYTLVAALFLLLLQLSWWIMKMLF